VTGKLVTLDLGRRIIMSCRTSEFPRDAHDSRVEVHFEGLGSGTRVTVLHTEIPEGQGEKYRALWNDAYFTPMRNHFSKYLPDPRNPPVRRPPPPPIDDEEDEDEDAEVKPAKGKLAAAKAKAVVAKPTKGPSVVKAAPSRPALPSKSVKTPPTAKAAKVAKAPPPKPAAKPTKAVAKPVAKPVAKKAAKPVKKPAKPVKKKR
jgi:hypothetical protein